MIKFQLRKTFYPFPVYEFNLPAGHSCPFASACKIKVDRNTGKFETIGTGFRCYAASAERFPAVRAARWENFEDDLAIKNNLKYAEVFKNIEDIPKGMRIDYDDTLAMAGSESFALLDNFKYNKKQRDAWSNNKVKTNA